MYSIIIEKNDVLILIHRTPNQEEALEHWKDTVKERGTEGEVVLYLELQRSAKTSTRGVS